MSFFTGVRYSFTTIPAGDIPAAEFLDACSAIIPVFGGLVIDCISCRLIMTIDALGSTAFAPVKSDINGNIKVMYRFPSYASKVSDLETAWKA